MATKSKENAPETTGKDQANNPPPAAPTAPPQSGTTKAVRAEPTPPVVLSAAERATKAERNAQADAKVKADQASAAERRHIESGAGHRTHAEAVGAKLAKGKPRSDVHAEVAQRIRAELGFSPAFCYASANDLSASEAKAVLAGKGREGLQAALAKVRQDRADQLRQKKAAERAEQLRKLKPRLENGQATSG